MSENETKGASWMLKLMLAIGGLGILGTLIWYNVQAFSSGSSADCERVQVSISRIERGVGYKSSGATLYFVYQDKDEAIRGQVPINDVAYTRLKNSRKAEICFNADSPNDSELVMDEAEEGFEIIKVVAIDLVLIVVVIIVVVMARREQRSARA